MRLGGMFPEIELRLLIFIEVELIIKLYVLLVKQAKGFQLYLQVALGFGGEVLRRTCP